MEPSQPHSHRVQHRNLSKEGDTSPSLFNQIGEVIVFGLEKNKDRWDRCEEILRENRINEVTRFLTNIDYQNRYRQCTRDFISALKLKRGNNIVFFEDDFELVEGWEYILDKAWLTLPKDFDLLYLGCNLTNPPLKYNDCLYRVTGAWMFHAVILSKSFIDLVLGNYDVLRHGVFDEWCRVVAPQRKFYMAYPFISYQRKGFSDFAGKYTEYDIFNNKYYKQLQKL